MAGRLLGMFSYPSGGGGGDVIIFLKKFHHPRGECFICSLSGRWHWLGNALERAFKVCHKMDEETKEEYVVADALSSSTYISYLLLCTRYIQTACMYILPFKKCIYYFMDIYPMTIQHFTNEQKKQKKQKNRGLLIQRIIILHLYRKILRFELSW